MTVNDVTVCGRGLLNEKLQPLSVPIDSKQKYFNKYKEKDLQQDYRISDLFLCPFFIKFCDKTGVREG